MQLQSTSDCHLFLDETDAGDESDEGSSDGSDIDGDDDSDDGDDGDDSCSSDIEMADDNDELTLLDEESMDMVAQCSTNGML